VNVDPAANVALLIFPVYGAADFCPQMFVFQALAHFDAHNDGLLRFGKEDDSICLCSNSPKSKLLQRKRAVFSPLNSHSFLFVFIFSAVVNRVGCKTSEICISTDKEE